MRYPTLSVDHIPSLVPALMSGDDADLENAIKWIGEGVDLELGPLKALASDIRAHIESVMSMEKPPTGDEVEAHWAGPLHIALSDVPLTILDDPGFWRYVALVELFPLVRWRESKAFASDDYAKYRVYCDGRRPAECVPLRMLIRARIAERDGDHALASAVPDATDLWRSHIVRVRTGYSPALAQGLLRQQIGDRRMPTDELRAYAKRLNRVASNVVLHTYEEDEVDALLDELRSS